MHTIKKQFHSNLVHILIIGSIGAVPVPSVLNVIFFLDTKKMSRILWALIITSPSYKHSWQSADPFDSAHLYNLLSKINGNLQNF